MPAVGVGIAMFAYTIGPTAFNALVALGGFTLIDAGLRKYASKKPSTKSGRDVTVRGTVEPRSIVLGEALVSGPLVYANTSGSGNRQLWQVVAIAGHECEDIRDVWLGDRIAYDANIDDELTGSSPYDGNVTGGWGASPSNWVKGGESALQIWRHLGTAAQTVDAALNAAKSSEWTSNHRLRGVAYIVTNYRLFKDPDMSTIWTFFPNSVAAVVRGVNTIYDPRLDTSPGANPTNASYQAWTSNPALVWAWYLTDATLGRGWAHSKINYQSVADAADVCDELVSIPPASPATTEKRYQCNGVIYTTDTYRENIAKILATMVGRMVRKAGQYYVYAGEARTSDYSFDESVLAGDVQFKSNDRADRYNHVRGTYVANEEGQYVTRELITVTGTPFQTRDNNVDLFRDLRLDLVNGEYQAQRIAYKHLLQSDMQRTVVLPCNLAAAKVRVGDYIDMTVDQLGWTTKLFRVEGIKASTLQGVELVCREDNEDAWNDPAVGEYSVRQTDGTITFKEVIARPARDIISDSWITDENAWTTDAYTIWWNGGGTRNTDALRCTGDIGSARFIRQAVIDTSDRPFVKEGDVVSVRCRFKATGSILTGGGTADYLQFFIETRLEGSPEDAHRSFAQWSFDPNYITADRWYDIAVQITIDYTQGTPPSNPDDDRYALGGLIIPAGTPLQYTWIDYLDGDLIGS